MQHLILKDVLLGFNTILFVVFYLMGGEGKGRIAITKNLSRKRGMVSLINVDKLNANLHNFGTNISNLHFFSLVNKQIEPDDV